MASSITLVPSSVTLVPGATGRTDAARDEREVVLTNLGRTIAAARGRAATSSTTSAHGVRLTVVAPAPVAGVHTTDDGVPDLGALGLLVAPVEPLGSPRPGAASLTAVDDPPGAGARPVRLHTAASVVTVLLRLAGWRGPIRTVEVGGEPEQVTTDTTDTAAAPSWPMDVSALLDSETGDEEHVLVFTTILDLVGDLSGTPDDSAVPSGVPDALLRADRAVVALYRSVVAGAATS